jgi:phosphoglycolate phosphatase
VAIKGILFDKDGTLIDYQRTWVPIHKEVALYAARGDTALAAELLRRYGQDPDSDAVMPNSVLAAGSVDDIADALPGTWRPHAA